ncbi:MAG: cob(I)yrinic acid a,c-diamide adenosyltransferase [Gammaproteobacteria bacterium]|nr:cob(I)yrinic acid a,c-diamide adenosyltransferase [Gammaproteobacteria bacterium]
MANRLTKIYTRTGDAGETGKADGGRLSKDDRLIHAQGDIDELNSFIGLVASQIDDTDLSLLFNRIQHDLFNVGAEISMSQPLVSVSDVAFLEQQLDEYNVTLPPLEEFILPGGGETACLCHVARAVCRRAERSLVALHQNDALGSDLLAYINRLSDLLFVLSRVLTRLAGENEVYWKKRS